MACAGNMSTGTAAAIRKGGAWVRPRGRAEDLGVGGERAPLDDVVMPQRVAVRVAADEDDGVDRCTCAQRLA